MNLKLLRSHKPSVVGHIATSDPAIAAIRIRERIKKYGTHVLWIAPDGCLMASDASLIRKRDPDNIIGMYTLAIRANDIADDIASARDDFARVAMQARA